MLRIKGVYTYLYVSLCAQRMNDSAFLLIPMSVTKPATFVSAKKHPIKMMGLKSAAAILLATATVGDAKVFRIKINRKPASFTAEVGGSGKVSFRGTGVPRIYLRSTGWVV